MTSMKSEFSVGIFALVVMVILTMMTFRVGDFSFKSRDGNIVSARFHNTAGLSEKTKIKIAGVNAGKVESIILEKGVAVVNIRLDEEVYLYSDATAVIRSTGLLGDKYIEISIGSKDPFLEDGGNIVNIVEVSDVDDLIKNLTNVSSTLSRMMLNLEERNADESLANILANVEAVTEEMRIAIAGDKKALRSILDRVDSILYNIDKTVQASSGPLTNTMKNAEIFSNSLKEKGPEILEDLHSAISRLDDLLEQTSPSLISLANSTDATMGNVQEITRKVNEGEGTIGKLVNDDTLYMQVSQAAGGLSNTMSRVERFRTYVNFRGEYLDALNDGKGIFTIELAPRKDKYYIIGIVSDPVGKVTSSSSTTNGVKTTTESVEQEFEFILQFARRFKDTTLRIGLMESTFGVGADQYLFHDRVRLSADVWDFGENEYLSENAHLKVALDIFATKNIFFTGGYDNILNKDRAGYFVGGGVRFEDDDLKYLLGSMPSLPGN
jgi:phospholipid/cholesterol/gamma-HCH transport system substrate-binding protein